MAKLLYTVFTSLDGYSTDAQGGLEWSVPDAEVVTFINEIERRTPISLYGRKMYEAMLYWETFEPTDDDLPAFRDFAVIWASAEKVVYSRTLDQLSMANARIERTFDPDAVRRMKESAGHDIAIGG